MLRAQLSSLLMLHLSCSCIPQALQNVNVEHRTPQPNHQHGRNALGSNSHLFFASCIVAFASGTAPLSIQLLLLILAANEASLLILLPIVIWLSNVFCFISNPSKLLLLLWLPIPNRNCWPLGIFIIILHWFQMESLSN